jgi:RND superfamily putative drug exporter
MLAMSRFVLRHKGAVVVFWLVVLVAGGAASAKLSSRLSPQFALPGAASYQANQQILRLYGNGGNGYPEVAVVRLPPGQHAASPAVRQALRRAFDAVTIKIGGVRVADYATTGDRSFVGRDGRTTYGLVFTPYAGELSPPSLGPQITAAMTPRLPPGSTVAVTGMNELQSGGQAKEGFGVLAETLLAGAAALGVLVLVFGSALALVPLLVAAVTIPACFLVIYGLAEITTVSVIVQYLAALIGLGVAIDYSLLLVTRWREELTAGHPVDEAVSRAMATAGRSVTFSGITVAIGLLSLIVLPVPVLRSIGIGGMIVPAVGGWTGRAAAARWPAGPGRRGRGWSCATAGPLPWPQLRSWARSAPPRWASRLASLRPARWAPPPPPRRHWAPSNTRASQPECSTPSRYWSRRARTRPGWQSGWRPCPGCGLRSRPPGQPGAATAPPWSVSSPPPSPPPRQARTPWPWSGRPSLPSRAPWPAARAHCCLMRTTRSTSGSPCSSQCWPWSP